MARRADEGLPFVGLAGHGAGREWIVEAFGCDPERLASVPALEAVFQSAVRELALRPVGETQWHQFPAPGGVTGMCLLAESHLTVHTFPEHASACFNLFCCTPRDAWDWEARLRVLLSAQSVRVRVLDRAYATVSEPLSASVSAPVSASGPAPVSASA